MLMQSKGVEGPVARTAISVADLMKKTNVQHSDWNATSVEEWTILKKLSF